MTTIPTVKLSLIREATVQYDERVTVPEQAAAIVRKLTHNDADESFYILALDVKNRINHVYLAAKGDSEHVELKIADLFRAAIVVNSSAIIAAHNHPSGDATPSNEDIALTARIDAACKILGIRFLDSLVVCETTYKRIPLP